MPPKKKSSPYSANSAVSVLGNALKRVEREKIEASGKTFDIISFSEQALGVTLFPAQKIVLKFFYAGTKFNEKLRLTDEEMEIVKGWSIPQAWIFEGGPDGEKSKLEIYKKNIENFAKDPSSNFFRNLVLILGRRSGKSYLTSLIAVYEAYKLISYHDPLKYFGIENDIWIINTAVGAEQAQTIIFKQIKRFILRCPMFEGRICKSGEETIILYTDADLEMVERLNTSGSGEKYAGSIVIASGNSNSAGLRGHSASIVIYDEMAHFVDTRGKASGSSTHAALSPSVSTFYAYGEGRNIIISSPDLPSGFFFDFAMASKTNEVSMIFQIPTWDAHPRLTRKMIQDKFDENPDIAAAEYGAQFRYEASSSYFPRPLVLAAMQARVNWYRKRHGTLPVDYFMHIDPAYNSDRWAILVAHPEWRYDPSIKERARYIVEDYSITFKAPPGEVLDADNIIDHHVVPLLKAFRIVGVSSDDYMGKDQVKKLITLGYKYRTLHFTGSNKYRFYENLKTNLISGRIELCNDDEDLQGELLNIIVDFAKTPPRISKQENDKKYPNDDLVDCLAGVVDSISEGPLGMTRLPRPVSVRTSFR